MNERLVDQAAGLDQACPTLAELAAFASGRVDEDSSRQIAEHVGRCAGCESALSHRSPFTTVPRAGEFDHEPEARRMIAAAKALFSDTRRPGATDTGSEAGPAESVSTKTELDATEGFSASVSQTRTYLPQTPDGLGRYEIEAALGAGTFGRVFRAYDTELDRLVAIKISNPGQEAVFPQTLLDEARSAARLHHPGIVSIFDVGRSAEGATFVVMQYVDGQSLRDLLGRERPSFERTVQIVEQIAKAVHYAHKHGLVHRDLKPGNVLIDRGGEVRVADFGLALIEDQQRSRAGEFAGTPAYMSPEQARGESHRLDGRADVWALGVILYEMLAGRRPFRGKRDELLDEIEHRAPKPPRQYDERIPIELERACLKCLEKQPERRYSTALDLVADLERWRVPPRGKRRRWPIMATAAAAACLIALAGSLKYLSTSSGLSGTSTAGNVSAPRLFENPFQWYSLLDRAPKPLFAPTLITERWHYDELRKDVEISSPGYFFLELGETELPEFKIKLTMGKTAAGGSAGVFLGYQPGAPRNGHPIWKCQILTLATAPKGAFRIDRDDLELEEVHHTFLANSRKHKWTKFPKTRLLSTTLMMSIEHGRIKEVRWENEKLDSICDQRDPSRHGLCEGRFGLVNLGGTTVFSDVEFQPGGRK